ncbi:hypothetical protein, partial [Campylobacter troglodytis]|uniref:hypothetical protein n=1 Tax=Campylobacter troglodytis TaxID=654363 RepID=UPI00163CEE05
LEFEWYLIDSKFSFEEISIVRSDSFLTSPILIGIIKSHKILAQNTALDFNQAEIIIDDKPKPFTTLFTPLPTAALAITKTKINDFFVNLRNKPNAKEGKI